MCLVWGIPYLFIKVAVEEVSVPVVVFARTAVGALLLLALGYATAPLIAARKLADVPALPMTAACLSLGALVWLPAAIATWPHRVPSGRALGSLAALGVICTACAFLVFLALIREAGTSRAMVFT